MASPPSSDDVTTMKTMTLRADRCIRAFSRVNQNVFVKRLGLSTREIASIAIVPAPLDRPVPLAGERHDDAADNGRNRNRFARPGR